MKKRRASKRESLHHKYKVERKIREAVRQKRKDARKHPQRGLKKDPGIPNLLPFKEEIIQKLEAKKARMEEDKERQKKQRLAEAKKRRQMSMTELQNDASMKSQEYELKQKQKVAEENAPNAGIKDGSRKAYYKEFKKVITAADVILEVLDARDPMGCRCPEVEKMILRDPSKKIILVLNKIDLVPKDIVEQWLKHLRQQFPTIAFKCNTQIQKQNKGQITGKTNSASSKQLQSSQCLGAETLLQLLKNYARNKDIKTAVTVGIVGYPNVGKSSLINSLKRARAAPVGATPGFTKTAQEVHIDKHVKLLDSPGIVFADSMDNELILRNCVKLEQIEDPVAPVELIIKRCPKEQLLEIYSIADFKDNTEFLTHIAMKRGKLAKGGVPDWKAASRTVLQDWNGGRIPFYTLPPENSSDFIVSTEVVSSWGKEFDIDSVIMSEKSIIETLPTMEGVTYTAMPSSGSIKPDEGLFRHLQNEEAKRNKKLNANAMEDDEDDGDYDDAEEMDEVDEDEDEEDGDSEEDGDEDEDGSDDDEIDDMRLEAYIPTGAKSNVPTPVFSKSKAKQQLLKQAKTKSQDLADPEDLINPQRNKNLKKTQKQLKKLKAKSKSTPSGPGTDNYDFSTDFYADDKDGDIEL